MILKLSYAALGCVVLMNILANVFMKIGSSQEARNSILFGVFGWQTLVGIACFGSALILYAWSLKQVPLYIAQSVLTLQYAGAVVAAFWFFGETIRLDQWLGLGLIMIGLLVVVR